MKSKHLLICFIFLILGFANNAQSIQGFLEEQQTVPFQKLYLHTDREFYFSGDTLWFAAYLVDGKSHLLNSEGFTLSETLTTTCNLYVDLINEEGEIIKSGLFLIQNGLGSGYVSLSDSIDLEGNFLLRAYTDYLKNFGDDTFFTKTIQVSKVKNSFELQNSEGFTLSETLTNQDSIHQLNLKSAGEQSENKIDISFLPEGGFLLADESNCVAFKAVNQTGKGKNVSGKLFDEYGNVVLKFQSVYKGAGKFYFYPKVGETYTAKIDSFPNLDFKLPEIKESGAKIKLINQEDNKLQMVVQGKNVNRSLPFYLACIHRGEGLFFMEIDRKNLNSVLKFNSDQLRGGINRFVLLDKNLEPVSERLVFQNDVEINQLNVQVSEESFSTREEVKLNIQTDSVFDTDVAHLSVTVVDENYVNASGTSQNIASYLLLDSELKGHIESPADYIISDDNVQSGTKLDLLMTTNGWSNYIWNSLKKDSLNLEFEPQLGFTFNGHVKRTFGKKSLTEGNASVLIFKSDSTTSFYDQPLDLNGNFEFRNIVFYDSASIFVQARNKNDNHNTTLEMELPKLISPEINSANLNQLHSFSDIPLSVYRQRYLNEMRLKEFYPDKTNILIDEIDVKAKSPKPKYKTGIPKKNDGPFLLNWEDMAGSFDIIQYLAYRVPGITPVYGDDGSLKVSCHMGVPASLILDGFIHLSYEEAVSYNPAAFETIEIVTPPMSNIYRALNGAIILTFRSGRQIDPASIPLLGGILEKMNGFTTLREFYSPKYTPENIASKAPDYRNTLYWNPQVNITNGEKELFFYTCDNISRYKVFVEGLTENGKICLGSANFEVNTFNKSLINSESSIDY